MIIKRVLKRLRQQWPETRILLRGDSHFANPELMQLAVNDPNIDFLFGLTGYAPLQRMAQPYIAQTRQLHEVRCHDAKMAQQKAPHSTRTFHDLEYRAGSWPAKFRVVLKAEVMNQGDNPRFVVTTLQDPTPELIYKDLYCPRGQDENYIKAMKNDLASDRTSSPNFLANHLRMFLSCAAYVLHHTLRTETMQHTELKNAQPSTVIIKLFKIAVRVVQQKNRVKLHLPTNYPFKSILKRVTEILYVIKPPPLPT